MYIRPHIPLKKIYFRLLTYSAKQNIYKYTVYFYENKWSKIKINIYTESPLCLIANFFPFDD